MRPRAVLKALVPLLVAGGILGLGGGDAEAQASTPAGSVADTRPAPDPSDLKAVAPPRGLPVEQERDPGRGPARHEPVFLAPAVITTEHVRVGLSAWIAPGAPFDHQDYPGGPAVGLTITWPPPARLVPSAGPSPWQGSAAR